MTHKAPCKIPLEQWIERAKVLREALANKEKVLAQQATEMFLLYNDRIRPEEFSRSCAKCVARVFKKLCDHLDEHVGI